MTATVVKGERASSRANSDRRTECEQGTRRKKKTTAAADRAKNASR